ncbi:hypothetical protein [Ectopseudomonas guguanensis]|uniref:hypothetical protein n=1 Tax=Ectopseudomonas guguanensis TaxID=1198456 RepID=UPI0028618884|nr:hypothetical protein [Pseudomonas guguanensis]MDR8016014.1 hypothetical protein [Pseudomonas guguanensis]
MDKVLLTVFLSALAAFITAALSIVKLVNEKESKTSEYRQSWTETVRVAFSELIANINSLPSLMIADRAFRNRLDELRKKSSNPGYIESADDKRLSDHLEKSLMENIKDTHLVRKAIFESYALVRLHFKPNDLSFHRVEQKFEAIQGLFSQLASEVDEAKRAAIRENIHGGSNDLTTFARDILKTEWETVKKGEPAYKSTKRWSVGISVAMLFILLSIGGHAVLLMGSNQSSKSSVDVKSGP